MEFIKNRAAGSLNLVNSLAKFYTKQFNQQQNLNQSKNKTSLITINPEKEVLPCNGASSGLYLGLQAMVNPGDEVLLMEPVYE